MTDPVESFFKVVSKVKHPSEASEYEFFIRVKQIKEGELTDTYLKLPAVEARRLLEWFLMNHVK